MEHGCYNIQELYNTYEGGRGCNQIFKIILSLLNYINYEYIYIILEHL